MMKKKNILLIHLFFWLYLINQGLFPLYTGQFDKSYLLNNLYFKEVFISILLNVFSFYLVYLTFPFLQKMKSRILMVVSSLIIFSFAVIMRLPVEYVFWKLFHSTPGKEFIYEWFYVWNNLRLVIITAIYAVLIRFLISGIESQKQKEALIRQQQAGELALIRSQVNPHFLFNTINNIYSLVYQKSPEAGPALIKLSSILRYMLYDAGAGLVLLEKEADYLKSFIDLQKLRIKNPGFVKFRIEGDLTGRKIAPMLLISFVENAFRHGSTQQTPGISILLDSMPEGLFFEIENYVKQGLMSENEKAEKNGIMLIKSRLELIYPGKHKLSITENGTTFKVTLEIAG
jgi:sensor histidine kinase YesM